MSKHSNGFNCRLVSEARKWVKQIEQTYVDGTQRLEYSQVSHLSKFKLTMLTGTIKQPTQIKLAWDGFKKSKKWPGIMDSTEQ